ncbi:MAG: DUF5706 domain-containing protein [Hyphomicrobiaceae bacterium]|nr:DUF5706 domain-containing protein [Hyphomicrobiaceae bacterium]
MSAEKSTSDAKLFRALQLVNEWLKFGEAKNGVLVTLNGAAVVGMHNVVKQYGTLEQPWSVWLWWATICCLVSLVIGISSFYAKTKVAGILFSNTTPGGTSAIYFGHLADTTKADLVKRLSPDADGSDLDYLEDMASQVIINARLARRKMALFNLALMVTITGVLTPAGAGLYYWRFCDDAV